MYGLLENVLQVTQFFSARFAVIANFCLEFLFFADRKLKMNDISQRRELMQYIPDRQPTEDESDCSTDTEASSSDDSYREWIEVEFPLKTLAQFNTKLETFPCNVSVLLDQDFECLLDASLHLCRNGLAMESDACQHFFRESLTILFTRNLMNQAVSDWQPHIHEGIFASCESFVQLCAKSMFKNDSIPLLDLLAIVFDPNNTFHTFHAAKTSKTVPPGGFVSDELLYARPPPDAEKPFGWLVDLINLFGYYGGFALLYARLDDPDNLNLSIPMVCALLRPFALCHQLLTVNTINYYFMPIARCLPEILDKLMDEGLKDEAKMESMSNDISTIINVMEGIISRVPGTHQARDKEKIVLKNLESLRFNNTDTNQSFKFTSPSRK